MDRQSFLSDVLGGIMNISSKCKASLLTIGFISPSVKSPNREERDPDILLRLVEVL